MSPKHLPFKSQDLTPQPISQDAGKPPARELAWPISHVAFAKPVEVQSPMPRSKEAAVGRSGKDRSFRQIPRSFLLLVAMPFVTSSFLLLVVRPGAPSSILVTSSDAICR